MADEGALQGKEPRPILHGLSKELLDELLDFGAASQPTDASEGASGDQTKEKAQKEAELDTLRTILTALYGILRGANLEEATEKKLRGQLQEQLGMDMGPHKLFVRKYVNKFLECDSETQATLASDLDAEDMGEGEGAQDKQTKPKPQVLVLGAGLAGLATATTLQRCGVDVVILEGGEPFPGSFQSHERCPIDLGHLPLLPAHLAHLLQPEDHIGVKTHTDTSGSVQLGIQLLQRLAGHASRPLAGATPVAQGLPSVDGLMGVHDAESGEWLGQDVLAQAHTLVGKLLHGVAGEGSLQASLLTALELHLQSCSSPSAPAAAKAPLEGATSEATAEGTQGQVKAEKAEASADDSVPAVAGAEDGQLPSATGEAGETAGVGQPEHEPIKEETAKADAKHVAATAMEEGNAAPLAVPQVPQGVARAASFLIACSCTPDGTSLSATPTTTALTLLPTTPPPTASPSDSTTPLSAQPTRLALPLGLLLTTASHGTSDVLRGWLVSLLAAAGVAVRQGDAGAVARVKHAKQGVTVTTESGESLEGKVAVLAVPLAILQAGPGKGLAVEPALPAWKLDVVRRMQQNTGYSVVIQTEQPFWQSCTGPALPHSSDEQCESTNAQPVLFGVLPSPAAADKSATSLLTSLVCAARQQPDGQGWLLGIHVGSRSAEAQEPEEVGQTVLATLRAAFSDCPEQPQVWAARCAPSQLGPELCEEDLVAAAAPIKKFLMFAGEWCAPTPLMGSVAGALLAGVREAARALAALAGAERLEVFSEAAVDEKAMKAALKAREKRLAKTTKAKAIKAIVPEDASAAKKRKGAAIKSKSVRIEEEEEIISEEAVDEDSDEGVKPKKRKTQAKELKRKRSKGEDAFGSGGGSGAEEAAEAKAAAGAKGRKARAAKAPEPEPEPIDTQKQQKRMEEEREASKAAYKALLKADKGDLDPLLFILNSCDNLDTQSHSLGVLAKASLKALDFMSGNVDLLSLLAKWLQEMLEDRSAEHLVMACLNLLSRLTINSPLLKPSGLQSVIKTKAMESSSKEVKRVADAIWADWIKRLRSAKSGEASTGLLVRASSHEKLDLEMFKKIKRTHPPAASIPSGLGPGPLPPRPAGVPPPPPNPPPLSGATSGTVRPSPVVSGPPAPVKSVGTIKLPSQASKGAAGRMEGHQPAPDPVLSHGLDPVLAAQLAEREAELEARQQAVEEKQRIRELEASERRLAAGAFELPAIGSFEEFLAKGNAAKSGNGKKRRTVLASAEAVAASAGSSAASAHSSGASADAGNSGMQALRDFVGRQLKAELKTGRITEQQWRALRERVVAKVAKSGSFDESSLHGKSKDKLRTLIEAYVAAASKKT